MRSYDKEKNGENNRQPRLIPLSSISAQKGIEAALASGTSGWERALRDFTAQPNLKDALESTETLKLMAVVLGISEWSCGLGEVQSIYHLGGGAVYLRCLKEEGVLQKTVVPRISDEDRMFWVTGSLPESVMRSIQTQDFENEDPCIQAVERMEEKYNEFTCLHPDFCAQIDEIDFPSSALLGLKVGAADVYALYKAHYDRLDMPVLLLDKSSWT